MLNLIWPRFFRTQTPELGCNAEPIRSTDWRDAEIKRLKDELGEADEEIVFKKDTIESQRREIESLRKQLAERHSDADYQAVRLKLSEKDARIAELTAVSNALTKDRQQLAEKYEAVRDDLSIVRQRVAKLREDVSKAFRDFESVSPPEPSPPVVTVENFDPNSLPDDVLPVGWWLTCDRRDDGQPYIVSFQHEPKWKPNRTHLSGGYWFNPAGAPSIPINIQLPPITDFSKACWQKTKSATAVESVVFQAGDKVEVIDASGTYRLTIGSVHVIDRVRCDGTIEIDGVSFGLLASRFKLISRAIE